MIKKYVDENEGRMLEELFSLIRIPSVSAQPEHKEDMVRCANRWKELLLAAGVDKAEVMPSKGNPMVYAEKMVDPKARTILVYGHYDVMPAEPLELWRTQPFEPVVKDGYIWARGADDDKGQSFIQAKAFEYLNKNGLLKHNMKFIFEGEEEIGSGSLPAFIEAHKDLLKCDVILVSDTTIIAPDTPSITTGLRGLAYWQIEVTGADHDLHSGTFGGAVANPANVLCKLIGDVTGPDGKIRFPGFYDDVEEASKEERDLVASIPFDIKKYKKSMNIDEVFGEEGYSTIERTGYRPSFDVCGIWGGYMGEGAKTVIPSKVYAKISTRLVPHQDYKKIGQLVIDYFNRVAPKTVKVDIKLLHGGYGYVCPIDFPAYMAAERAFETVFGKRPLPVRIGGSIPIISTFENLLGAKSLLMGFGLESNAIHSPNENMPIDLWKKGIETIINFHQEYDKEA